MRIIFSAFCVYTVSKTPPFYIMNKLAKNEPILLLFGVQKEILHKKIVNLTTLPE